MRCYSSSIQLVHLCMTERSTYVDVYAVLEVPVLDKLLRTVHITWDVLLHLDVFPINVRQFVANI